MAVSSVKIWTVSIWPDGEIGIRYLRDCLVETAGI